MDPNDTLQWMRALAELQVAVLDDLKEGLENSRAFLAKMVGEYTRERQRRLQVELTARGLICCTRCERPPVPTEVAVYLEIQGWKGPYVGYDRDSLSLSSYYEFHRVCPTCLSELQADKVRVESDNPDLRYHLIVLYLREGSFFNQAGDERRLLPNSGRLREPTSLQVDGLAEEWGIPPRIELIVEWSTSTQKLIIHEPQKAEDAEAA